MIIKINKKTAGARLDKFLTGADLIRVNRQTSRNLIQKLIKQKIIMVNGLPASPNHRLKPNDIINLQKNPLEDKQPIKKNVENAPGHFIDIIAETDDFLIINKPAGLAVHGAAGYTLADWLKAKYPKIKNIGDDPARPGLVHRLDKDVSGLMVIAKTMAWFNHLKKQFQNRTITKEYTALVYGKIKKDSGFINFPIKRARDGYKMAALPLTVGGEPTAGGRTALTEFRIIARLINYTLLKIKIITGRTHQIRVHLAAFDHPIVGDNIYGTAKTRGKNKKLGLNRIFLVADRLSFNDLNGNRVNFKINLNEELKNILKIVK